jgi:hypothetical protein
MSLGGITLLLQYRKDRHWGPTVGAPSPRSTDFYTSEQLSNYVAQQLPPTSQRQNIPVTNAGPGRGEGASAAVADFNKRHLRSMLKGFSTASFRVTSFDENGLLGIETATAKTSLFSKEVLDILVPADAEKRASVVGKLTHATKYGGRLGFIESLDGKSLELCSVQVPGGYPTKSPIVTSHHR